jgi:SAM-dependent methyltransferase
VTRPERLRQTLSLVRLWRREPQQPEPFYRLLAARAAEQLERSYGPLRGQTVVDLGCGPGFYTRALRERGAEVIPVDNDPAEMTYAGAAPEGAVLADAAELPLDDDSVDGLFCSNMLEHTPHPERVIAEIERVLRPGGWTYVSFTNWYSPWGGHSISPYHYLGPRLGPRLHDRLHGPPAKNRVGEALFPTHIGPMLRFVRSRPRLRVERVEPRYWPRLALICRIPLVREVLTWNCVIRAVKA